MSNSYWKCSKNSRMLEIMWVLFSPPGYMTNRESCEYANDLICEKVAASGQTDNGATKAPVKEDEKRGDSFNAARREPPLVVALQEVADELRSAQNKFPPFNSLHEGFSILKEEVDELWEVVRMKQSDRARNGLARKEAIQVGAMALRLVLDCCCEEGE
jgi:hypothetical protein